MPVKLFLSSGLFFFLVTLTSFNRQGSLPNARAIQQIMTRVNDSLYVCKYETSNSEYRNFLESLKGKEAVLVEKYRIDSTGWGNDAMAKYYHLHPAYKNYP